MPILISGEVDLAPGARTDALAGAQPWIEAALAEAGCVHYSWTADPVLPDRVHVFEQWDSAGELAAHLASPAYFGMLKHMGQFGIVNAVTRKYRCDLVEPVYGADGVATATFTGEGA
jgi:quinol monooxygenase YgiN